MNRKSIIASIDILSRNFRENDPIGVDLRTMALAMSKMSEEEFAKRVMECAPNFEGMEVEAKKQVKLFKCPDCGTKVMEQTKYCLKCKKKVEPPKTAAEEEKKEEPEVKEEEVEASQDFWSKEASTRIAKALVADVLGIVARDDEDDDEDDDDDDKGDEKEPKDAAMEEEEVVAPKKAPIVPKEKKEDVEAAKKPEEKKEPEACAMKAKEEKAPEIEEEKEPEEEKESRIINTDILASITFGDIQMEAPVGVISSDEAGEMSAEEKSRLAQLFK